MLKQILIDHFKSYRRQTLPLASLTLLVGANASGKSNAIEAFRFLCWLAQGQKLSALKYRVDDSEDVVRGQISDLGYLGADRFRLGCIRDNADWNHFEVEVGQRDGELHLTQERISSPSHGYPLYQVVQQSQGLSNDIRVAYNNFAQGGQKPQLSCSDQIAVMCQLVSSAMFLEHHKKTRRLLPEVTQAFQDQLKDTLFLDPVPSLMREESHPAPRLRGDGANLSGVLFQLWQDRECRPRILEVIRSLPEQDVVELRFQDDRRGRKALVLVESFGGHERECAVELLSDGTLRVLAIVAALLSAPEGGTVVIEEVDNGVHPSRARTLLNAMQTLARERSLNLLLSTHNPALMDALPDEALGDVVFCYRDPEVGDSRLARVSDLDDYPGLVTQGPLGDLVTRGVVDRFVKTPGSHQKRKAKALKWLESMEHQGS